LENIFILDLFLNFSTHTHAHTHTHIEITTRIHLRDLYFIYNGRLRNNKVMKCVLTLQCTMLGRSSDSNVNKIYI